MGTTGRAPLEIARDVARLAVEAWDSDRRGLALSLRDVVRLLADEADVVAHADTQEKADAERWLFAAENGGPHDWITFARGVVG